MMRAANNTNGSETMSNTLASERYEETRNTIDAQLETIKLHLARIDARHKYKEKDWGYVGSVGYVTGQLAEIIGFLRAK